jgi:hypothetical protein
MEIHRKSGGSAAASPKASCTHSSTVKSHSGRVSLLPLKPQARPAAVRRLVWEQQHSQNFFGASPELLESEVAPGSKEASVDESEPARDDPSDADSGELSEVLSGCESESDSSSADVLLVPLTVTEEPLCRLLSEDSPPSQLESLIAGRYRFHSKSWRGGKSSWKG